MQEIRDAGGKHKWPLPPGVEGRAVYSPDGDYRYVLRREWDEGPIATFVGLNPSTAEAHLDDPTVRKCWRWASSWGYGQMVMLNAFAYRATSPAELDDLEDPIGKHNEAYMTAIASDSDLIVAAWGNGKILKRHDINESLGSFLISKGKSGILHCLGTCKDGSPRHPLYLPTATLPTVWRRRLTVVQ